MYMKTVMIVDDDLSAQEQVTTLLEEYGHFKVVLSAGTVADAERMLMDESPDILFLDLELPDGNGMDMMRFVRKYHPGMYVVVFTAFYQQVGDRAYQGGEDDYLLKPILRDEFDKVIRRYEVLSHARGEHDMPATRQLSDTRQLNDAWRGQLYDVVALTTMRNEIRPTCCNEIGFFRYNGERKVWTAMLKDATELVLKKGTSAKDIQLLSPMFQQAHQSYIVNLQHVRLIGNTQIKLNSPFQQHLIPVGRTFLPTFLERYKMI